MSSVRWNLISTVFLKFSFQKWINLLKIYICIASPRADYGLTWLTYEIYVHLILHYTTSSKQPNFNIFKDLWLINQREHFISILTYLRIKKIFFNKTHFFISPSWKLKLTDISIKAPTINMSPHSYVRPSGLPSAYKTIIAGVSI